jgi:hypothetical protein
MAAKKILFLVGDFTEDYEVMVPFQALTASGMSSMRCARVKGRPTDQNRDPRFRRGPDVHRKAGAQLHAERHFRRGDCRRL